MDDKLPDAVKNFIDEFIDSSLQLEILLLFQADLCGRGLLHCAQNQNNIQVYQYAPLDPKLADAVASLTKWHSTHRVRADPDRHRRQKSRRTIQVRPLI